MALSVNTPSTSAVFGTAISFSHTTAGSNRFLAVTFSMPSTTITLSGVTYAGVAMTQGKRNADATSGTTSEVWYLNNPATGANTVAGTLSGFGACGVTAISMSGAAASAFGAVAQGAGNSNSASVALTTTQANSIVVSVFTTGNVSVTGTATGTNQTERSDFGSTNVSSQTGTQTTTSTGSYTSSETISVSGFWSSAAIEVKELAATDPTINVSDSMTITESIGRTLVDNVNKSDTLTITESTTAFLPALAVDNNSTDPILRDTFTDTDAVLLQNHTGEKGATWTQHPSNTGSLDIRSNRVRPASLSAIYYASGVPPTADYDVTATIRVITNVSGIQVAGRVDTAANTMYLGVCNLSGGSNQWQLFRVVAGAATSLGGYTSTPVNGTDHTLTLRMRGDQISLMLDGATVIAPVTDANITAAGRVGIRATTGGGSATTGAQIDTLVADTIPSAFYDTSTITESSNVALALQVNVSDTATTTENIRLTEVDDVKVSDISTITESIKLLSENNLSVSDSQTTTESVTILIPTLNVNVSDSSTISESLNTELNSFVNKSDSSTITEGISLSVPESVSVSDTLTTTENIKLEINSQVSVSDNSTISEASTVQIFQQNIPLSVSDSMTISESLLLQDNDNPAILDNISISENVKVELTSFISKSDSSTITESLTLLSQNFIAVSDTSTTTENAAVSKQTTVNVSDTSTISESVNISICANISVNDTSTISESILLNPEYKISVSDNSTITESVAIAYGAYNLTVSDTLTITENIQATPSAEIVIPYRLLPHAHTTRGARQTIPSRAKRGSRPIRPPRH